MNNREALARHDQGKKIGAARVIQTLATPDPHLREILKMRATPTVPPLADTTKNPENVAQRRRSTDWPTTAKRRTVLDGGCVVLAFPGYELPPVVNKRRGRLPSSVPRLSDERKRRLERQEWARMQAKRIAELECNFRVAGLWIQILRNGLADMGYDLDGSLITAKKAGGKV